MRQTKRTTKYNLVFLLIIFTFGSIACHMKQSHQWRAIIAFNKNEQVSEDWNWFFSDIKNAAEKKGILVTYAGPNDKWIIIGKTERPDAKIALSPYWTYGKGYLFIAQGKEIVYQPYDQSYVILKKASEYFGIHITK